MAKVQQKSEKISAFSGIFFVLDKFDRILSSVIDSHLGLRSKLIGYQYSEIIRAEGGEYTYRCILTNDWDMTDEEIIQHYNKRGTAEQVFDRQNNDFGWAHLPKSFMNQNTVFLLLTAMAANFYQYIVSLPLMCLFGVEATDRVKSFLFRFIAVSAKWIRTARQNVLNVYSGKPYGLIWAYG